LILVKGVGSVARALWLMVVGRVVAASVNEDCIDENGWAILDKLHPLTIAVKPIRAIINFVLSPPTR
jgi:hypothetical protein